MFESRRLPIGCITTGIFTYTLKPYLKKSMDPTRGPYQFYMAENLHWFHWGEKNQPYRSYGPPI